MTTLPRRPLWLVLALVFVAYVGLLGAGFVFDDHALIEHNTVLSAPTFDTLFRRDLWCCTGANPSRYYRPMTTLSLLADARLWGLSPAGFHLTSLLLHLLSVSLVYALLAPRLDPSRAAGAALLFGLHPIQSEAVAWVAARNDPLSAAGVLGALVLLDRRTQRAAIAAGLLTLFAALAKESAWMLPLLAWCWRRAWGERLTQPEWLSILSGVAGSLALRALVVWSALPPEVGGHARTLGSALRTATTYLGWIVWPWPLTTTLTMDHLPPSPVAWLAAPVCLALLAWSARRGAGWLLAMAVLAFVPAGVGIASYGLLGERYLYLPLFGIVAAAARVAPAGWGTRLALAGWTLGALATLHVRVPDWKDDVSLFAAADARLGDSASRGLHASAMHAAGEHLEALRLYTEALALTPTSTYSCPFVVKLAEGQLAPEALGARLVGWSEGPCRAAPGFAASAVEALFRVGRWGEAERVLTGLPEPGPRLQRLEAAMRLADGDLLGGAAPGLEYPAGLGVWHAGIVDMATGARALTAARAEN